MEGLFVMLEEEERMRNVKMYTVKGTSMLSHIIFAFEVIMFVKAMSQKLENVRGVFLTLG